MNPRQRLNYLWIETTVVLLFYLVPFLFTSEAEIFRLAGPTHPVTFVYHALHFLITDVGQIAVVLFIIGRSNDPFQRFGIHRFRLGRDLLGGIAIAVIVRTVHHLTWWSFRTFLSHSDFWAIAHSESALAYYPPSGIRDFALLAPMCLLSGFVQELVMRAYLITRFEELLESTRMAVLFSTMFFVFYHGYQGLGSVIDVAIFGLIQALIFCLFRRLAPIALSHGIYNFISIGRINYL